MRPGNRQFGWAEGIYAAVNSGSLLTWDGTTGGSGGGEYPGDAHEYASS